jgi:hypothetical protein
MLIFKRVRIVAKSDPWLRHVPVHLSVCLSASIGTTPNGRFFVKFDIRGFYEDLCRHSRFGYNWTAISDISMSVCDRHIISSFLLVQYGTDT